jgi:hypothetical protein
MRPTPLAGMTQRGHGGRVNRGARTGCAFGCQPRLRVAHCSGAQANDDVARAQVESPVPILHERIRCPESVAVAVQNFHAPAVRDAQDSTVRRDEHQ